jgi:hypothetical protein
MSNDKTDGLSTTIDLGKGRTTKCLERVCYERWIRDRDRDPRPTVLKRPPDPGPCDWGEMADDEVDACRDKGRCVFHGNQHSLEIMSAIDAATGYRNLN